MTPAEKRVKELIDRWLTSLDLHLQYVDLKDSAYNNVQPWPVHDRPTRWVLEHARQKVLELQNAFDARLAMGDSKFAESVEVIVFLANLVGLQHVQRFIPLADPEKHGAGTLTELDGLRAVKPLSASAASPPPQSAPAPAATTKPAQVPAAPPPKPVEARTGDTTVAMPPRVTTNTIAAPPPRHATAPASTASAATSKQSDLDATREMPRPVRPPQPTTNVAASVPVLTNIETKAIKPDATSTPPAKPIPSEPISEMHNLVIGDAVRLLNWGKSWHELADLIVRIADRPKLPEIRKILRTHRPTIEMRAAEEVEQDPKPKDGKKDKGKAKQR